MMPGVITKENGKAEPREVDRSEGPANVRSEYPQGSIIIALLLFIGNFLIQSWALGRQVRPGSDEGVYLYQAKLMAEGYLPYVDFAMTSHVPFLACLNALALKLCNSDMLIYHHLYVAWVFLTIFPLFYTVLFFTRSRMAGIFSCVLFSTFVELVQWDAHSFAVRQASLPFFACFLYFFFVKKNAIRSQIFLSLFSFCLITNFFISMGFMMVLFLHGCVHRKKSAGEWVREYVRTSWVFAALTFTYFGLIAFIPGSTDNLLAVQQPTFPYLQRIIAVKEMMPLNWPVFLFGALGIFFYYRRSFALAVLSVLTLLTALFAGGSFYTHYLAVIAVPFAATGGMFIHKMFLMPFFNKGRIALVRNIALAVMICYSLHLTVYSHLSEKVVLETTPGFFQTVVALKNTPEPLFTLKPIYALYAQKNSVIYYQSAQVSDNSTITNRGAWRVNLSDKEYRDIIHRSNTVLLEPFADRMLPGRIKEEIIQNSRLVFTNGTERVYVRNAR